MAETASPRYQFPTEREQQSGAPERFSHPGMSASQAAAECFREYARERPEVITMWAFGLGFLLGWKLRIW
jgi:hypothetical protein